MMHTETDDHIPAQLVDALRKGLGRTFELVNAQNHAQYREHILDACIHNYVYDPRNEVDRAQWLFELLEHVDGVAFYEDDILVALDEAVDPQDRRQLLRLTAKLALHNADALDAFFQQIVDPLLAHGKQILISLLLGLAQRDGLADTEEAIGDYLHAQATNSPQPTAQAERAFFDLICQQIGAVKVIDILR